MVLNFFKKKAPETLESYKTKTKLAQARNVYEKAEADRPGFKIRHRKVKGLLDIGKNIKLPSPEAMEKARKRHEHNMRYIT